MKPQARRWFSKYIKNGYWITQLPSASTQILRQPNDLGIRNDGCVVPMSRAFAQTSYAHGDFVNRPTANGVGSLHSSQGEFGWMSVRELADLARIAPQNAQKAIGSGLWRGATLNVRQIEIGRGGASGKAPQVHVDSLPSDLREAWYLSQGIALNERAEAPSSAIENTVLDIDRGEAWNRELELARFKLSILSPALAHKDRTSERAAALIRWFRLGGATSARSRPTGRIAPRVKRRK